MKPVFCIVGVFAVLALWMFRGIFVSALLSVLEACAALGSLLIAAVSGGFSDPVDG
jgi:hypothetical protein